MTCNGTSLKPGRGGGGGGGMECQAEEEEVLLSAIGPLAVFKCEREATWQSGRVVARS